MSAENAYLLGEVLFVGLPLLAMAVYETVRSLRDGRDR